MPRSSARQRIQNEVNAGSMADIAFLLLIFFLVTATIVDEKGLLVKLPPWDPTEQPPAQIIKRNLFSVLINVHGDLLVRGEVSSLGELRDRAKEFIVNPHAHPSLSQSPKRAVISIMHDRGTQYSDYIMVYNELQAAYNEIWDEESRRRFGKPFSKCVLSERREIKKKFPLIISEAEPSDFSAAR